MARLLFTEKDMEICLAPNMMKGRLTKIIKSDKSTLVNIFSNKDMPIAPPSKKLFGSKKPFSPMLAMITPLEMNKKSLACRV
jgi:hypothetical protein